MAKLSDFLTKSCFVYSSAMNHKAEVDKVHPDMDGNFKAI